MVYTLYRDTVEGCVEHKKTYYCAKVNLHSQSLSRALWRTDSTCHETKSDFLKIVSNTITADLFINT